MAVTQNGKETATLAVLIRPEPPGQHTAQVVGLPELCATAPTPDAALQEVQRLMQASLSAAQWAQVVVPTAALTHPLQRFAGHDSDPNEFAEYQEEIRRYRQEVEAGE